MKKSEFYFPSCDGVNQLHCILWEPEGKVKGILQISHGMVEYVERYERFACALTEAGYVVVGNDHLGHGKSAKSNDLGYFAKKEGSKKVVDDLYAITKHIKQKFKGLPYFAMGHSMGSFMIRRYIMSYGDKIDGVIIMGTGNQPSVAVNMGMATVKLLKLIKGERYRSVLCDNLSFGSYNKRIKPLRTSKDWLTRDKKVVDAYLNDPLCSYIFTLNGFETLLSTVSFIQNKKNIARIPKELPILLVAGEEDPVGAYGKGVKKVYETYCKNQIQDVEMKLYPGARHEILNEINYEAVTNDILSWMIQRTHNIY